MKESHTAVIAFTSRVAKPQARNASV